MSCRRIFCLGAVTELAQPSIKAVACRLAPECYHAAMGTDLAVYASALGSANDRAHAAGIQKSALRERKRGRPGVAKPVGFATPHGPFSASDASRSMSSRRRTLCAAAFAVPPRRAADDRAHAAAVQKSAALGAEGGTGLGVAKPVGFATPRAPFSPCGRRRKHVVEVANTLRSGATQVAHTNLIPPRGPPGIASGMPLQVGHPWHRFGRPRPRFGARGTEAFAPVLRVQSWRYPEKYRWRVFCERLEWRPRSRSS
jgi:hypothetical protein